MSTKKKRKTYHGDEAKEKIIDKVLENFRPVIPNEPYSGKPIILRNKDYTAPKDYREILTTEEKEQLKNAVPNLSDAGIEAVMRRVYNMGDERIKKLTLKQICAFCEDYTNSQNNKAGGKKKKRKPLSANAAAVYELLKDLPEHRAMKGREILKAFENQKPPKFIDQSTLTKNIIPELRPYGVINKRGAGYYISK